MKAKQFNFPSNTLFLVIGLIGLVFIFASVLFELPALLVAPFSILFILLLFFDFKKIYYLLFLCLPISTEFYLPNGLATDLPTEPIMWVLLGTFVLFLFQYGSKTNKQFFTHPISLAIYFHLAWILITTISATNILISVKFLLAKIWYVIAFFIFTGIVI
ncbi:MAG: O-antigen ligase family protein, partial [Bacteroidota bacterium]